MKKQGFLFLAIFFVLTIGMHFSAWVDHPLEHFLLLPNTDVYGLGAIHPIVFTLIIYLLFSFVLWIVHLLWGLFSKRID